MDGQSRKPKINFTIPIRWLTDPEDKKFLGENLYRNIVHRISGEENLEYLIPIVTYMVELRVVSKKPVDPPLSKTQAQALLKKVFPNGKCINVDVTYEQSRSKTGLPLVDFRIYF